MCCAVKYCAVLCCIILCCAVLSCAVLYHTVLYCNYSTSKLNIMHQVTTNADCSLHPTERDVGEAYNGFRRKMVFKPHNATVLDISFCPTCPLFATAGADGTIFFFDTSYGLRGTSWAPLKFIRIAPPMDVPGRILPPTGPSSHKIVCERISWRLSSDISSLSNDSTYGIMAGNAETGTDADTAVCCCSDGVMREYSVGHLISGTHDSRDSSELSTYETTVSTVERVVRVPVGFSLPPPPSAPISMSVRSNSVALSSPVGATASMPMSPVAGGKESSSASQVSISHDLSALTALHLYLYLLLYLHLHLHLYALFPRTTATAASTAAGLESVLAPRLSYKLQIQCDVCLYR